MRTEMVFDGGRLHVLPLKEISTPLNGVPSVENGWEPAGGIIEGTCEITSLETGDVTSGPLDVDPDGTSASIDLGTVGPGRVLVQGKVHLSTTGTNEVFGGFSFFHQPVMSAAAAPGPRIYGIDVLKRIGLLLVCLLGGIGSDAVAAEIAATTMEPAAAVCPCGPDCACSENCQCAVAANDSETPNSSLANYPEFPDSSAVAFADEPAAAGPILKPERSPTAAQRRVIHRHRVLIRLGVRAALNAQLRDGELSPEDRERIQMALDDRNVIESLAQYVQDIRSRSIADAISKAGDGERPILEAISELIQALIPTLIEILKSLIPLLVAEPPPAVGMLDVPAGWLETPLALAC